MVLLRRRNESVRKSDESFPRTLILEEGFFANPLFYFREVTFMGIGAVICTDKFNDTAMLPVGKLSAVQRMVAAFQKIGVDMIAVLTGAEDKEMEKHLSQYGVLLFKAEEAESSDESIKRCLAYINDKCERVFVAEADRPLVSPCTLSRMLSHQAGLIIPIYADKKGSPVLLTAEAAKKLIEQPDIQPDTVYVPVDDDGILLSAADCQEMTERIEAHDASVTRLVLDMSIYRGKQIADKKLVSLLHYVDETQSVRDACARIQVSYSTAWNMLNRAEKELGYALIHRNKGGASGSGTFLTEKGSEFIRTYAEFETLLCEKVESLYTEYFTKIIGE